MAFADPQTVTYATVDKTLAKAPPTGQPGSTTFLYSGGEFELVASHANGPKRTRHVARLNRRVIAADPLTAVNAYQSMSAYLVVDIPLTGFSVTDQKNLVLALTDWLSASSAAQLLKLLGNE